MRNEDDFPGGFAKQRLEALTDGVYAVALTLLVLDLKLPVGSFQGDVAGFEAALRGLVPNTLTWLLSFWVIANFWIAQVRLFQLTKAMDARMYQSELGQLALISLLPFSTSLIGEHGEFVASAVIYSLNLTAIAALSWLRTAHVLRASALHAIEIPSVQAWKLRTGVRARLGCSVLTLVFAFFWPGWNMLAMLPLFLLPGYLERGARHFKSTPENCGAS